MNQRQITKQITSDLKNKMVLLSGPRQCGKTTLSKQIIEAKSGCYLSWDIAKDRKIMMADELPAQFKYWTFDELHKFKNWRNWLKGVFDEHHLKHSILVTGSARLDSYARGGDSLQGRFFKHRLHPFTLSEYESLEYKNHEYLTLHFKTNIEALQKKLHELMVLGGFPEPLFEGTEKFARRWRQSYGQQLTREEIRDLEQLSDLNKVELLFDRLPDTVGSVLSINAVREDLEVAFATAKKWIGIFEKLYGVFRIYPYGPPKIKAVKKEAKLYFWDWSRVPHEASRFENLIATHLLRFVHWIEDVEGRAAELRYIRNFDGKEIDFVILIDGKPMIAIEAKSDDKPIDSNLTYFLERVYVPQSFQISLHGMKDYIRKTANGGTLRVMPASKFLSALP